MSETLTPLARAGVDFFQLSREEQKEVERCIRNYSLEPNCFTEEVSQIVYQILELLKHHFNNSSDWDLAKRAIADQTHNKSPLMVKLFLSRSRIEGVAEYALSGMIKANGTTISIPKFISDQVTIDRLASLCDALGRELCRQVPVSSLLEQIR